MWKMQYPDGNREINALHVPVDKAVKLTMASEDVIHSFSIPAFRVRHDVVPGHYDALWFKATKPGRYRIFCTEYCGDRHSQMVGWVDVLDQASYNNWAGGGTGGTLADQGKELFTQNGCSTCHLLNEQGRCPILKGLYNKPVQLNDGRTVIADDAYLRESILQPNAKIVNGFDANVMPNFQGPAQRRERDSVNCLYQVAVASSVAYSKLAPHRRKVRACLYQARNSPQRHRRPPRHSSRRRNTNGHYLSLNTRSKRRRTGQLSERSARLEKLAFHDRP